MYHFEFDLLLVTPGVFISYVLDGIVLVDSHDILKGERPEYLIDFEGSCPNPQFDIATIVQGDDHIDDYIEELQLLDEQVYRGALTFLGGDPRLPLGNGRFAVDWRGVYCFEVE